MYDWKAQIKDILHENFQVIPSDRTLNAMRDVISADLLPKYAELNIINQFAGHAMQALIPELSRDSIRAIVGAKETRAEVVSKEAYDIAFAMLSEFNKRKADFLHTI